MILLHRRHPRDTLFLWFWRMDLVADNRCWKRKRGTGQVSIDLVMMISYLMRRDLTPVLTYASVPIPSSIGALRAPRPSHCSDHFCVINLCEPAGTPALDLYDSLRLSEREKHALHNERPSIAARMATFYGSS